MNDVKLLLKFGKNEDIVSFVERGLFCSNAKTFWGIEDKLKLKGQGDRLEASCMIFSQDIVIHDNDNHRLVTEFGASNGLARFGPATHIPVFCLFAVHENDCFTDKNGNLKIKLSTKTKKTVKDHFPNADSVAVIRNPKQFLLDIENTIGCEIKHELVHYYFINDGLLTDDGKKAFDMQYFMYLSQDVSPVVKDGKKTYCFCADYAYRTLFCKDVFFADEQEYRIVLPHESVPGGKLYPVKYSQKPEIICLNDFFSQT